MKVWIVSDGEPLPLGEEKARLRRMGLLSQILSDRKHDVYWMTSNFHHYKKKHYQYKDELVKVNNNLSIVFIGTKGYKKNISIERNEHFKSLEKGFIEFTTKLDRPDIIISTLAPINVSNKVVEYANTVNIPVIIDVRDLWPDMYLEVVPKVIAFLMRPYVYHLKKKVNKLIINSTATIAVTEKFLERVLNNAEISKRKFDTVFNTSYPPEKVDKIMIDKKTNLNYSKKYNIEKDDFILLFLGTIGKQFEFEPIIAAAKLLSSNSNIKFIIAGEGVDLKKIKDSTVDFNNIIFPGWIEKEEINYLLAISKVGLAPYRKSINFIENIPNKFGEYLSASLPVAINIDGEMKKIIERNTCGFHYESPNDLAEKIVLLNDNKEKILEMQINSKEVYNKQFNSEIVYNEMAEHLEEISRHYSGGK